MQMTDSVSGLLISCRRPVRPESNCSDFSSTVSRHLRVPPLSDSMARLAVDGRIAEVVRNSFGAPRFHRHAALEIRPCRQQKAPWQWAFEGSGSAGIGTLGLLQVGGFQVCRVIPLQRCPANSECHSSHRWAGSASEHPVPKGFHVGTIAAVRAIDDVVGQRRWEIHVRK